MLNAAFVVRVQARQPLVDVEVVVDAPDVPVWKASNTATVAENPE